MEKTASLFGAPGRSDVWNANRHYCHFRRKYITLMMTIIASTELILIQTMCSSKLRMDSIHNGKHIMDIILLIRRVMLGAPSLWEIICKWPALWCCRVINKSSYQNEKWNFKNERVSINLGHCTSNLDFGVFWFKNSALIAPLRSLSVKLYTIPLLFCYMKDNYK